MPHTDPLSTEPSPSGLPSTAGPAEATPSNGAALARWFLMIGATFVVLALGFIWLARSVSTTPATASSLPGSGDEYPTPDFRLASLEGETMGPPDFSGQVVIIDFWATWCGPCKLQAKVLEELHPEYAGKGVQFLAINLGEDEDTVRDYLERSPFPYPVLLDPREELMTRFDIFGLPTTMIVDTQGEVSFLRTGVTDVPTLRQELGKAGAGA